MKATRAEVYKALDGERDYQEKGFGNAKGGDTEPFTLHKGVVLLDAYLAKAKAALAGPAPDSNTNALEYVRKVTALGVKTLEENGAPERVMPEVGGDGKIVEAAKATGKEFDVVTG